MAVSSSPTDSAAMTLLALRPKAPGATMRFGASFAPHNDARYDQLNIVFGDMGVSRSFDEVPGADGQLFRPGQRDGPRIPREEPSRCACGGFEQ